MQNYKQVLRAYEGLDTRISSEMPSMGVLLTNDDIEWDVAVSYAFSIIEYARRYTLYMALVRKWNVNAVLAWETVQSEELKDDQFWELMEDVLEKKFSKDLKNMLRDAKLVRNKIMHGHNDPSVAARRKAIGAAFDFLGKFGNAIEKQAGFYPFGSKKGLLSVGKGGKRHDAATSRLILKGLGFKTQGWKTQADQTATDVPDAARNNITASA